MNHPNAKGQIFNVSSGKAFSVNEIYEIIDSILKTGIKPIFRDSQLFWDKYPFLFEGSHGLNKKWIEKEVDKFTLSSTEKTKKLLDWKAVVSIEEGLKVTIEHAKKTLLK